MAGGDYSRVRQTFWTDPDIKRVLSAEQKALLLYFITSPHANMIGLYHCPLEYAAAEVGLDVDDVSEWVAGPLSRFLSYDFATEEVLVHNYARHQIAETLKAEDKRMKRVVAELASVHSKHLVRRFLELYADWTIPFDAPAEDPTEGDHHHTEAPSKGLRRGFRNVGKPLRSHSIALHSRDVSLSSLCSESGAASAPPVKRVDGGDEASVVPLPRPATNPPPESGGDDAEDHKQVLARYRAEAVTIILDELWQSTRDRPPGRFGRDWSLDRELSIWRDMVKRYDPEEVNGAMRVMRRVGGFGDLEPLSLLLFRSREPQCRDLWNRCLAFHRKQVEHEASKHDGVIRVEVVRA